MNSLLQELKRVELDILARFIQVCQQLDLRYYILQGTLLGAVRHQGFIPWDDDIDVGMPRADYEIFLREGQKLLGEPYFVQTFLTDPPFTANFAKIRNSNTTFVETSLRVCTWIFSRWIFTPMIPGRRKTCAEKTGSSMDGSRQRSISARSCP